MANTFSYQQKFFLFFSPRFPAMSWSWSRKNRKNFLVYKEKFKKITMKYWHNFCISNGSLQSWNGRCVNHILLLTVMIILWCLLSWVFVDIMTIKVWIIIWLYLYCWLWPIPLVISKSSFFFFSPRFPAMSWAWPRKKRKNFFVYKEKLKKNHDEILTVVVIFEERVIYY